VREVSRGRVNCAAEAAHSSRGQFHCARFAFIAQYVALAAVGHGKSDAAGVVEEQIVFRPAGEFGDVTGQRCVGDREAGDAVRCVTDHGDAPT